jgi:hypothetical protein
MQDEDVAAGMSDVVEAGGDNVELPGRSEDWAISLDWAAVEEGPGVFTSLVCAPPVVDGTRVVRSVLCTSVDDAIGVTVSLVWAPSVDDVIVVMISLVWAAVEDSPVGMTSELCAALVVAGRLGSLVL